MAVGWLEPGAPVVAIARRGPWVLLREDDAPEGPAPGTAAAGGGGDGCALPVAMEGPLDASRGLRRTASAGVVVPASSAGPGSVPTRGTVARARGGSRECWMLLWHDAHGILLEWVGGAGFEELPESRPMLAAGPAGG